jgi:hypothetical protein
MLPNNYFHHSKKGDEVRLAAPQETHKIPISISTMKQETKSGEKRVTSKGV